MGTSNYVHIPVIEILKETDLAFLVVLDNEDQDEVWIPMSQISGPEVYDEGDKDVTISVTEWFCHRNSSLQDYID